MDWIFNKISDIEFTSSQQHTLYRQLSEEVITAIARFPSIQVEITPKNGSLLPSALMYSVVGAASAHVPAVAALKGAR